MKYTARIFVISTLIFVAAVAACPGVCDARKLTDYTIIKNLEFGFDQGLVTAKSPRGDCFSISGRTMFLVEYTGGGENMVTSFHGLKGEDISFNDLKVGDYVYVYGGALRDDTRAAKDVFVTSGKLTGTQRKAFIAEKKLKPWKKEGNKK